MAKQKPITALEADPSDPDDFDVSAEGMAAGLAARRKRMGRPPQGKESVTIRLDSDVLAAWRATGPGWQTRLNERLRSLPVE